MARAMVSSAPGGQTMDGLVLAGGTEGSSHEGALEYQTCGERQASPKGDPVSCPLSGV